MLISAGLLTLLGACSDDGLATKAGTDGETAASTTGLAEAGTEESGFPTTSAAEPACGCYQSVDDGEACTFDLLHAWAPACVLDAPCAPVTVACPDPGNATVDCPSELVYDEAALQCALEALRDGVAVRLDILGAEDHAAYTGQRRRTLWIAADAPAIAAECIATDVGVESEVSTVEIAAAAHFEGCLGLTTPAQRYDCLREGLAFAGEPPQCE
jgi:hypothetical protein